MFGWGEKEPLYISSVRANGMSTARLLSPWARRARLRMPKNKSPKYISRHRVQFPRGSDTFPRCRSFPRAPAGRTARNTARRSSRCSVIKRGGRRRRGERGAWGEGSLSSPHPRLPLLPGQLEGKGFGRAPPTSTETASRCLLPSQLERCLAHARANEMRSGSERRSWRFEQRHQAA